MLIQKQILVFIFSCLVVSCLQGQNNATIVISKEEKSQAEQIDLGRAGSLLRAIKNGVLVIKVPTGSKKLKAINEVLAKRIVDSRLEAMREQELSRIAEVQITLIGGFKKYYTFSPFICVYDTNYLSILNKTSKNGIFYDGDLQLVPNYSLEGKSFCTFREDQYFHDENKANVGYVVTDSEGNLPPIPFPYAIPYKFKRFPLFSDNQNNIFGIGTHIGSRTNNVYKARYSWRYFDTVPYYAVVKFLQTKLDYFEWYLSGSY
jgi:hypothetical protein